MADRMDYYYSDARTLAPCVWTLLGSKVGRTPIDQQPIQAGRLNRCIRLIKRLMAGATEAIQSAIACKLSRYRGYSTGAHRIRYPGNGGPGQRVGSVHRRRERWCACCSAAERWSRRAKEREIRLLPEKGDKNPLRNNITASRRNWKRSMRTG